MKLLTVAPHAVAAEPGDEEVETFVPELTDEDLRVRVVRREEPEAGTISLGDARVVVGGGRGVGSAEGFAVLQELAGRARRGRRRLARRDEPRLAPARRSDRPDGLRIGADLYIACGISGAIQHWVGCKGAKTILAINTDRDAPIVQRANYAVIGDLHEVVPAIVAALRERSP